MSPIPLNGRVVAITGSTGGLGSAVARALRDRGALLALLDLDAAAAASQAAKLGDADLARGCTCATTRRSSTRWRQPPSISVGWMLSSRMPGSTCSHR